jgi:DNA repair protein RecO (recombination protein O)
MQSRRATDTHDTLGLVLRRTPYAEADLILSVFTQALGQVSVLARSARKSQRRFGQLEPLHTLRLSLDETRGSELLRLRDASMARPRSHLLGDLNGMEAAGRFLGWVRHAAPRHTREPDIWRLAESCLDGLEAAAEHRAMPGSAAVTSTGLTLAAHGLALLTACGWRLELERCVLSGRHCPEGKSAMIDPARGGLVSRSHGVAPFSVSGALRKRLSAAQDGDSDALTEGDAELALALVERCLQAHAGLS